MAEPRKRVIARGTVTKGPHKGKTVVKYEDGTMELVESEPEPQPGKKGRRANSQSTESLRNEAMLAE